VHRQPLVDDRLPVHQPDEAIGELARILELEEQLRRDAGRRGFHGRAED
jgi:hypothetical protein